MPILHGNDGTISFSFEMKNVKPADVFRIAQQLCNAGYEAQGGAKQDPDERDKQTEARKTRKAGWFEELYCTIRNIADDWHREAVRRKEGTEKGQYEKAYLEPATAIDRTGACMVEMIKDRDY